MSKSKGPTSGKTALEKKLMAAIRWALGETDFRPREPGEGPYYWRRELAARAGLEWNGSSFEPLKFVPARSARRSLAKAEQSPKSHPRRARK